MKPVGLVRGFVTVGGWTLLSRGVGFARDIMMAAYLGAGPVAEAFLIAFSLPNMFRRFFAEGAFNMAFVPMFAKKLEAGEDAQRFARDAFNGLAGILILFTLIGTLAMPYL
ncbi:MAG: lipid II flippase MurJ, partial [Cereibacter changlensis]